MNIKSVLENITLDAISPLPEFSLSHDPGVMIVKKSYKFYTKALNSLQVTIEALDDWDIYAALQALWTANQAFRTYCVVILPILEREDTPKEFKEQDQKMTEYFLRRRDGLKMLMSALIASTGEKVVL